MCHQAILAKSFIDPRTLRLVARPIITSWRCQPSEATVALLNPSAVSTAKTALWNRDTKPTRLWERTSTGSKDVSLTHMISLVWPTERGAAYQSPSRDEGAVT
jgi:hypothetical protein